MQLAPTIEDVHVGAARNGVGVFRGEQIREVVQIIGAAKHQQAEIAGRNLPTGDAIVVLEQRAIEREDGGGIGEIDGGRAGGISAEERR